MKTYLEEEGMTSREFFRRCTWHYRSGVGATSINGEVVISFGGKLGEDFNQRLIEDNRRFSFLKFRFRDRFNFGKRQIRVKEKDGDFEAEFVGGPNYEVNRHWQSKISRNKVRWKG